MTRELGHALREARIGRGIELGEVERVTKIRVRYLRAMEEDRWDVLPAPAYARGFLSTYARYLGLDERALLEQYRRAVEETEQPQPIPEEMLPQQGILDRRPRAKTVVGLLAGVAAVVVLGVAIVGSPGEPDDGGNAVDQRRGGVGAGGSKTTGGTPAAGRREPSAARPHEVSLELRSTGTVWVCLVDDEGRALVNGETLTANDVRGPFAGRAFEVTFGNGSIRMTVDAQQADIPAAAEPLGFRVTSTGVRDLDPSARPTCL